MAQGIIVGARLAGVRRDVVIAVDPHHRPAKLLSPGGAVGKLPVDTGTQAGLVFRYADVNAASDR